MQRHKFKTAPVIVDSVSHVKRPTFSRVNTFSDCIKDAAYTTSNNQVIRVMNPKFDQMKDLI